MAMSANSLRERLEQFLIIEGFTELKRGEAMVMADALIAAGYIKDPLVADLRVKPGKYGAAIRLLTMGQVLAAEHADMVPWVDQVTAYMLGDD
jgi:hypothetical protein